MDAESKVVQWGDSLAICIPDAIAEAWGVWDGTPIEIIQCDSVLVLRKKRKDLATLVAQITDENRHEEIDTGPPVGWEVW